MKPVKQAAFTKGFKTSLTLSPPDIQLNWVKKTGENTIHFITTVKSEGIGLRVDQFLARYCPFISRNAFGKIFDQHQVFINDRPVKKSATVQVHNKIHFVISGASPSVPVGTSLKESLQPPEIAKETKHWVAVNKPALMTVHPTSRYPTGTLIQILKNMLGTDALYLCHRLDRETSGLLLVAKSPAVAAQLGHMFISHQIQKYYKALVRGLWPVEDTDLKGDLIPDSTSSVGLKQTVLWNSRSLTHTRILRIQHLREYSLLDIELHSGKMHQIRAHLNARGFPIAGDKIYPDESIFLSHIEGTLNTSGLPLARHGLHASRIKFICPVTKEPEDICSQIPPDMAEFMERYDTVTKHHSD